MQKDLFANVKWEDDKPLCLSDIKLDEDKKETKKPVKHSFTDKEKCFIIFLKNNGFRYIVRDKDGTLFATNNEVVRNGDEWVFKDFVLLDEIFQFDSDMFKSVTWDTEPLSLKNIDIL